MSLVFYTVLYTYASQRLKMLVFLDLKSSRWDDIPTHSRQDTLFHPGLKMRYPFMLCATSSPPNLFVNFWYFIQAKMV